MSLTNYGEVKALSLIKGDASYYLALMTVVGTEESGGTEVSGGSYARKALTFTEPVTDSTGVTSMTNSAQIEFPTATASWGTVVGWAIFDALTGGNMLWYGNLSVAKEISAADTMLLHAGDLILRAD